MIRPYKKYLKIKYLKVKCLIAFLLVSIFVQASILPSVIAEESPKKMVVFIMDRISFGQLEQGDYPTLNNLRKVSSEGLVNVRSQAIFIPNNPESAYLTIGAGTRRDAPNELAKLIKEGQGVRISDRVLSSLRESDQPLGTLGQIFKDNGLKIGVLSSSQPEKPSMGPYLLAMDKEGRIPYSHLASNLTLPDTKFPDGYVTDNPNFLAASKELYLKTDLLIIDYSDTARAYQSVPQQQRAIKAGDQFLGELLKELNDQDMLLVLSPNVSLQSQNALNFSLAPIIMHQPQKTGEYSLTTNNTRRPGLVLNLDIIPTVCEFFAIKKPKDIIGEPIKSITKTPRLDGGYRENYLVNLSKARILVHSLFVVLLVWLLYFYKTKKLAKSYLDILMFSILAYPLSALIIGSLVSYTWYKTDAVLVLILALVLGRIIWQVTKDKTIVSGLVYLSFTTSIIIIGEAIFWPETLLGTPFGFNDVFIGGRFYGLNNDIMGIMLGSSALALFTYLELRKIPQVLAYFIGIGYFALLVFILSPFIGVNVGGSITALVMLFFVVIVLAKLEMNWWKVGVLLLGVMALEVGIASLDNIFNQSSSHAGKAVAAIAEYGPSKVLEILKSKLSQVALMLVSPPWNMVLGFQFYYLYKLYREQKEKLLIIKDQYPFIYKGGLVIIWGGITGFAFNDTGVVAAGLMLLYLTIPLTLLIREKNQS